MLTETVSARMEARHLGIVGGPRLAVRAVESILGQQPVRENGVFYLFIFSFSPQGSCQLPRVLFESAPVI